MAAAAYRHLYQGKRWYRLRYKQLQKDPLCCFCADRGVVRPAAVVDHIKAHRGNEDLFFDADNLQSLCKHCHDSIKQQMEKSGVARGCDESGMPLDPNHHWGSYARSAK
ncbi:HNH endonuclease signature motif containing protein [Herbaspirillum sp. 1130]|uniref:HNH endonuclease n=1 Tax=Herbaspirillum sp. 1130 TaxID=2806562 RepID=UPI001AE8CB42|nr:HNH endonuclease signature motif containing protein [Herbaspirillum sp. 1130]